MLRVVTCAAVLSVGATLAAAPSASAATAASDTVPPSVVLEPEARFILGQTFGSSYFEDQYELGAQMSLNWRAADASGICAQTITEQSYDTLGGEYDPYLGWDTSTSPLPASARSHPIGVNTFDTGRIYPSFYVRVTDCAGNSSVSTIAHADVHAMEDNRAELRYAGAWRTSNYPGFSGGTTRATLVRGASVTFSVDGGSVALVMERAPNRGAADVYVDGVRRGTVNTYSATTKHKYVAWQSQLRPGTHTIRLVNKATAGHPRIDLDAVLTAS
jgi:hypothetical protein